MITTCKRCEERPATHHVLSYDNEGTVILNMNVCGFCAAAADAWPSIEVTPLNDSAPVSAFVRSHH